MKTVREIRKGSFWCGWIFGACVSSLYQDIMGRDRWIEMVRVGWMTPWVSVPLAIVGILLVMANLWETKPEEAEG
jgi:hypothetical protein